MMTRRSRRTFVLALGAAASGLPFTSGVALAETYTLRLATFSPIETPPAMSAVKFATAVARRSKGQLTVEVYPNGVLSRQADTIPDLVSGNIDFIAIGSGPLQQAAPRLQILDMPFLFKDVNAAYRIVDGPVGAELGADLESKGILALAWASAGMRQVETTTKVVQTVADLKGLRIRVQAGAVYTAMFQALGAIPVVIDSAEVFLALQQHAVDGIDQDLHPLVSLKYGTIAKHIAMLNQIFAAQCLFASKKKIGALPAPMQTIIREEAKTAAAFWRAQTARVLTEDIQVLKNGGCTFTQPNYAEFRKAVEPVYAAFQSRPGGEFIERIARTLGTS